MNKCIVCKQDITEQFCIDLNMKFHPICSKNVIEEAWKLINQDLEVNNKWDGLQI